MRKVLINAKALIDPASAMGWKPIVLILKAVRPLAVIVKSVTLENLTALVN